jgi:7-cyano-7-deazaguanine synthase in queuosine biosynthesis
MADLRDARVLVMLSGGIDSTGLLWQLLNKNEKIHVHHMNLKNRELRDAAESIAVSNILDYCKKFVDFTHSESTHEYPSFYNKMMWDTDIISFMSGMVCQLMPWIKEVAIGMTKTDFNDSSINTRVERANNVFNAMCEATKVYPLKDMTKREVWDLMPKELQALTWSCRTPVYGANVISVCGKCKSCKELNDAGIKIPNN